MLGDYLKEAAMKPWDPGQHDCCTFPADWCIRAGYPDPMAWVRGTYHGDAEATDLAQQHGLLKLATQGFESIGLQRTKQPKDGDVAVIKRLTEDLLHVSCAIRSGDRWITLIDRGLFVDAGGEPLRIWRVEWARQ